MQEDIINVDAGYLEKFMADVFSGLGIPLADAIICAEVLIASDRRGIESHGINRCKPIYYDRIKAGTLNPITNFEVVRETMTTAVVDGHNGMGHVIGRRCMEMAIKKARNCGMGMVAAAGQRGSQGGVPQGGQGPGGVLPDPAALERSVDANERGHSASLAFLRRQAASLGAGTTRTLYSNSQRNPAS